MSENRTYQDVFNKANTSFAKRLRELIPSERVEELKEYLHCTPQAINQYKQGTAFPKTENLIKIAEFLGVSMDYLLGFSSVSSLDPDVKAVCQYTGLSEKNVQLLHENKYPTDMEVVNELLSSDGFWEMVSKIAYLRAEEVWVSTERRLAKEKMQSGEIDDTGFKILASHTERTILLKVAYLEVIESLPCLIDELYKYHQLFNDPTLEVFTDDTVLKILKEEDEENGIHFQREEN